MFADVRIPTGIDVVRVIRRISTDIPVSDRDVSGRVQIGAIPRGKRAEIDISGAVHIHGAKC